MKKVLALLGLGLLSVPAYASEKLLTVYHVSRTTCGKYLADIAMGSEYHELYSWWLAGFLTGVNLEQHRVTATDKEANELWVKQYCEKNPLEMFVNAAAKLSDRLSTMQAK